MMTRPRAPTLNTHLNHSYRRTPAMLGWSLTFLIIAIVAGIFGFTGIAGTFAGIAKIFFFIFLILLIISAIVSAFRGRPPV